VIALALPTSFAALERLPMAAAVVELDGTMVAVNAAGARLLARPMAELLGRKSWEFAPGLEHVWLERLGATRADGPQKYEIAIATPEGAHMVEYLVAVCELDGRPYVVAFVIDTQQLV
jgi:PAS domain S-box-containing protein